MIKLYYKEGDIIATYEDLFKALSSCDTDVEGALYRLGNDKELYVECIGDFLEDRTVKDLEYAIENCSWDAAFTAAHALKGLAGNLGFVGLFHLSGEMVIAIRKGSMEDIYSTKGKLDECYNELVFLIKNNIDFVA